MANPLYAMPTRFLLAEPRTSLYTLLVNTALLLVCFLEACPAFCYFLGSFLGEPEEVSSFEGSVGCLVNKELCYANRRATTLA